MTERMSISKRFTVRNMYPNFGGGAETDRVILTPIEGASVDAHEVTLPLTHEEAAVLPLGGIVTLTLVLDQSAAVVR